VDHVRRNHVDHGRRLPRHRQAGGDHRDEFYSAVPAAGTQATGDVYFLQFDATTWGWIHLIGGLIVMFAGFGLFSGAVWARTVGVIVAVISAIVNFAWMPGTRSGRLRWSRSPSP
jgi:hypothetical protein